MPIVTQLNDLGGALPRVTYRWDVETEILSGHLENADPASGFSGAIELEGPDGAVVTLEVQQGAVTAIEVAVWPEVETTADLRPPQPSSNARLTFPNPAARSNTGVVEFDVLIAARRRSDDSVIHLRFGRDRAVTPVRVAANLLVETDREGLLAGFWLTEVPPFPQPEAVR